MKNQKRLYGIRGAVGTKNTEKDISSAVQVLFSKLLKENSFLPEDVVSIQFTLTSDLTALNPAKALRNSDSGASFSICPLFCSQEPQIDGSPKGLIRILITTYSDKVPVPVYCNGAEILRPDLCGVKSK